MANAQNQYDEITDKRLPIVFLLDVSGSMLTGTKLRNRLLLLNQMLVHLICECMKVPKVRMVAEVCFMLFTDEILLTTRFRNIRWMDETMLPTRRSRHPWCGEVTWTTCRVNEYDHPFKIPQFGESLHDDGTNIGFAVKQAVSALEHRVKELHKHGAYPPFMILISDGHPTEPGNENYYEDLLDQNEAIEMLRRHTKTHRDQNNLIFPFVIGVGDDDINKKRLSDFAQNFRAGYFHVRDEKGEEDWAYLAEILAKSITSSVTLNDFEFFDRIENENNAQHSRQ